MAQRKIITFEDDLIRRADEWRRRQPDLPGFSEAVRRLMAQALDEDEKTSSRA